YFSLGLIAPGAIQFIKPSGFDPTNPALEIVWFTTGGADAAQDAVTFGDQSFYLRVGRFTVPTAAGVATGSELDVGLSLGGTGATQNVKVSIPACPN
ncbi:MAG: hypothetical protein J0L61_04685, partial [Planctomycetes bacterium]|nr:hypothetical protein [Planctomycetota bacterium]